MDFAITNTLVSGLDRCIVASGNSFRTLLRTEGDLDDKDLARCERLGSVPVGSGHDSFLNGITVVADFTAPLYWWKQAQRYHWFEFVSSQSTMHCVTKFNIVDRCVSHTNKDVMSIVQSMVDRYNEESELIKKNPESVDKASHEELWNEIIASLPCGFCLSATMTTNYRQLKTMCQQRKGHKLKEWSSFIDWCLTLPKFSELTKITK